MVALVLFCSLLAGACGIPTGALPTPVTSPLPALVRHKLPKPSCPIHVGLETISIYLLKGVAGSLVPVTRCVSDPVTPQTVLVTLEEGPLPPEYRDNLESAINVDSRLQAIGHVRLCHRFRVSFCGLVVVRLDHYFSQLQGEAPIDELGQIVWSLTESHLGISEVRFVDPKNKALPIEIASGTFVNRPVSTSDYLKLGG